MGIFIYMAISVGKYIEIFGADFILYPLLLVAQLGYF